MDSYADALGVAAKPQEAPAPYDGSLSPQERTASDISSLQREIARAQSSTTVDPKTKEMQLDVLTRELSKKQSEVQQPAKDAYADALGIGGKTAPVKAAPAPASEPIKLAPQQWEGVAPGARAVLANQVSGIGANIVGGYRGLATLLTGGTLDDAANNVRESVQQGTYSPTQGAGSTAISSFASPANPVNMPGEALDWAGGKVTDATGSPALGAAVNAGGTAALAALGFRGKPGTAPVEVGPARPGVGVYRPMQLPDNPTATALTPNLPKPAAPAGAAATPASPTAPAAVPMPTTPEAIQAVAEKTPAALFPEVPTTVPGGLAADKQLARAKVLESVGIDPNKIRRSAIAADGTSGSTDFQTAKLDSPAGREMKAVIDGERNALINHADSLVGETGGTHGVDSSNLYARGNTIIAPLDGLKQWFDQKTSALYKAADERAQGTPTTLTNFSSILGDASELTNSDRVHLQGSVNAYLKKLGMSGEDGTITGSAKQAETVRKYLNENWSPQNSRLVGKLKDALDEDVTASAGEDIYSEARKIRALRGQTLDNPNGIAKLMDSSGPEGINRAVPVEKIADSVTGMPVDQFSHVVKTLRESPPELQSQSQAALAEIKAQFANKVQTIGGSQAGQWNAKGVTKYLQNNAARMAQVFSPEELAKFRNLNDAGHIVAKDQSYPGAAVQAHNLATQGVMTALPTAGAAAGGYLGGPMGAAVGSAAGRMAAGAVENASTLRAVKKRTVKLSDLLDSGVGQ